MNENILYGFVQAFLVNIGRFVKPNDPQNKVTPPGFLQMLLENGMKVDTTRITNSSQGSGKDVTFRYQQRGSDSEVTDVDDCETPITPLWKDGKVERPLFSKIGMFISDEDMRKFQNEASQDVVFGSASISRVMFETFLTHANGLIQKIDKNILLQQATNWGVNSTTGTRDAKKILFSPTTTLRGGIVELISDAQYNEIDGPVVMVGNGYANNYAIANALRVSTDALGYGRTDYRFYNDINTQAIWGANRFGVFAPSMTAFVDWNANAGDYGGVRGGSHFFTIPVPVVLANGTLTSLIFDAQLKYEDCPIFDGGGNQIAKRGWKLIISKSYGLFNTPSNTFTNGDRLAGTNGTLQYEAELSDGIPVNVTNPVTTPIPTKEVA